MYEFSLKCQVVFGENAIEKLPSLLKDNMKKARVKKPLLITSEIMEWNQSIIEKARLILSNGGFETSVFDGVEPNPTLGNIEKGKKKYDAMGCDAVIALGGGSPIDAAKIIAHECNASVLIVIPTTAGSGSEVSAWSVISDNKNLKKLSLCTRTPDTAILDPVLTVTMPPLLTFFTAIDAFSHALESYISNSANCFSDSLALKSIQMTAQNLDLAVKNGNDMTARTKLLEASLLSGIAMVSAGLGVGHALANTIGGIYHDSIHGWLIAQILENAWAFNKVSVSDKNKEIESAVQKIFLQIGELSQQLNLSKDCLKKQHLDLIVENSIKNINIETNPKRVSKDELRNLLASCFKFI
jgi:alcohol dehydrogenase class IV